MLEELLAYEESAGRAVLTSSEIDFARFVALADAEKDPRKQLTLYEAAQELYKNELIHTRIMATYHKLRQISHESIPADRPEHSNAPKEKYHDRSMYAAAIGGAAAFVLALVGWSLYLGEYNRNEYLTADSKDVATGTSQIPSRVTGGDEAEEKANEIRRIQVHELATERVARQNKINDRLLSIVESNSAHQKGLDGANKLQARPGISASAYDEKVLGCYGACENLSRQLETPAVSAYDEKVLGCYGACSDLSRQLETPAVSAYDEKVLGCYGACENLSRQLENLTISARDKKVDACTDNCYELSRQLETPAVSARDKKVDACTDNCYELSRQLETPAVLARDKKVDACTDNCYELSRQLESRDR